MYYVYFDKETRNILSVSNEKNQDKNFVIKEKKDILDFFTGEKNLLDYKFDKDFNIVSIEQKQSVVDEYIQKVTYKENSDISVTHGKEWKLCLRQNNSLNYSNNVLFAITEKNNPNILIRNFTVSTSIMEKGAKISFKYSAEENLKNISIWTFDCPYTCGLTND